MSMEIEPAAKVIFSDLPSDEAIKYVSKMPYHSGPSFVGPLTYAAYKYIPTTYIICEQDMVIPPEVQRQFIGNIERMTGKPVSTVMLDAGHCPNVTAPENVARAINQAIVEG
jgi:pimeloyl-ACP methyl ester carboxylesterase